MAHHFHPAEHNPPAEPLRIAKPEAYAELPPSVRRTIEMFHGESNKLLTALEHSISHLPVDEQQTVSIMAFRALGIALQFNAASSTLPADPSEPAPPHRTDATYTPQPPHPPNAPGPRSGDSLPTSPVRYGNPDMKS